MPTVKESVLQLAAFLPDNCTWDDVRYQIYVRMKVEEGMAASKRGDVVPHEDVVASVNQRAASSENKRAEQTTLGE